MPKFDIYLFIIYLLYLNLVYKVVKNLVLLSLSKSQCCKYLHDRIRHKACTTWGESNNYKPTKKQTREQKKILKEYKTTL